MIECFFDCLCRMRLGRLCYMRRIHIKINYKLGYLDDSTEALIKSRSIRKEDNPDGYEERLKELNSSKFQDAVYAYGVRKLANSKNIEKLKNHATDTKNPIFIVNAIDVRFCFYIG